MRKVTRILAYIVTSPIWLVVGVVFALVCAVGVVIGTMNFARFGRWEK